MPPQTYPYGQYSKLDVVKAACGVALLPFVVSLALLRAPFVEYDRHRHWRRIAADAMVKWIQGIMATGISQHFLGSSLQSYEKWCKEADVQPVVEEVEGSGEKIMWMGDKNSEFVLLYYHGGGFVYPVGPPQLFFWDFILTRVKGRGVSIGLAMPQYGLLPTAAFPTRLVQATAALAHVLKTHPPSKILLVGESAGANLIAQIISHALHPISTLPSYPVPKDQKLLFALILSPYSSMTPESIDKHKLSSDILAHSSMKKGSSLYLSLVPPEYPLSEYRPYFEPSKAPEDWFAGADGLISHIVITSGSAESIRDSIALFAHRMSDKNSNVSVYIEKNGKHAEPIMNFNTVRKRGDKPPRLEDAESTRKIEEWIYRSCTSSK